MSTPPATGVGRPSWKSVFVDRFVALRQTNFRLFWTGHALSVTGTWMQHTAVFWLIYRLTDSPFMLGLAGVSFFLPILCFSLLGGVLADRVDRRKLVRTTQTLHFFQACTMASVVTFGDPTAPLILALALIQGLINAFDFPGRQTLISELVPPNDLPNAIALNSMAFNMARLVGPALAGLLLARWGEAPCFWLNALSYTFIIWNLTRIRLPERQRTPPESAVKHLRQGMSYVFDTPRIRNLLVLMGLVGTLGFQFIVLLPVFAGELLDAGASGYGLLMAASGVGSLSAFFRLTARLDRPTMRRNLLIGLLVLGTGLIAISLSRLFWLSVSFSLMVGLGMILYTVTTNMMIQNTVKDEYRGRVMSLFTLMLVGTSPVGSFLLGSVAEHLGAPVATAIGGTGCILGAIWVVYRLRLLAQREAEIRAVDAHLQDPATTEKSENASDQTVQVS